MNALSGRIEVEEFISWSQAATSMPGASLGALPPAGWKCGDGNGEIKNGEPQCKEAVAVFKHSQSLEPEDVWTMKVACKSRARIGFALEGYDVERDGETYKSIAKVRLNDGTTIIGSDISEDGKSLGETLPYDLALRVIKDGNMPQLRFNEDGEWHNLAPEGGTGMKAGPWFPYL